MGFIKHSLIVNLEDMHPLNIPEGSECDMYSFGEFKKIASMSKDKNVDLNGFDIDAARKESPDHLFVKVFAIREDEVNDNGDLFSAEILKKSAHTFIGVPVFVNHQNDDVEKARGKVVHAWYDKKAGGIYTINMVDKVAYPKLARGIENKYITGTSMGAKVGYSVCSVCHKKAANPNEFCSHIKERKGKSFSGDIKCSYHEGKNSTNEECPICKKAHNKEKNLTHDKQQVFEYNYDVNFIEDSFVVNPACHDCLVCDILNSDEVEAKIAKIRSNVDVLVKAASVMGEGDCDGSCDINKTAGVKEIGHLNEAMNLMERVARSLMAQKNKVSMEYVSDIVKTLANIQSTSDELIEMGYAALNSPTEDQMAYGTNADASPINKERIEQKSQSSFELQGQQNEQSPSITTGTGTQQEFGDDIGVVTKPTFIKSTSENGEDYLEKTARIKEYINKINKLAKIFENLLGDNADKVSEGLTNTHVTREGDNSVVVGEDSTGEVFVSFYNDDSLLKLQSINDFDSDMKELLIEDPKTAANTLLQQFLIKTSTTKNEENVVSDNIKNSQASSDSKEVVSQVVTENQMDDANLEYHPRTGESPETIQESGDRLGGSYTSDVNSNTPAVRTDSAETVTEDQLTTPDGYLARWNDFPEVITESQWDDMSRAISQKLPSDWTEVIGENQLNMLRNDHRWTDTEVVTESQLDDGGGASERMASFDSPNSLMKSASQAIADAIVKYRLSPKQIKSAASTMGETPHAQLKSVYMTLANASPVIKEARKEELSRRAYFSKIASNDTVFKSIDGVVSALADNLKFASADKLLTAFNTIVNDDSMFASVEEEAFEAHSEKEIEASVSPSDSLKMAFYENKRSDDGLYKICVSIGEDVSSNPENKEEFIEEVIKVSQGIVKENFGDIDVVAMSIDLDESNGTVECVCKEASMLTDEEKTAHSNYKQTKTASGKKTRTKKASKKSSFNRDAVIDALKKESQMMGGQMPAGLNPEGMGAGMPMPGSGGAPEGMVGAEAMSIDAPESLGEPGAEEMAMDEEFDGEPKPPGAICLICGNNDCDVSGGGSKSNVSGLNYTIKVIPDASLLDSIADGAIDEGDMGEDMEEATGMGVEMPAPGLPVAAMTKITPDVIEKYASVNPVGSISPISGTTNTLKLDNTTWQCLDSNQTYNVKFAASKDNPEDMYVQWEWVPQIKKAECDSCIREKNSIEKALGRMGVSRNDFDTMDLESKAKVLDSVHANGLIESVKEASSEDIVGNFKKAYTVHGSFPMEACLDKLARKFGENSLALSGPCEGKNLPKCVCKSLSGIRTYNSNIAIKVAEAWSEKEASIECVEDFIRMGYSLDKSASVCDMLKSAYRSDEEAFASELAKASMGDMEDGEYTESDDEVDPFDGDSEAETDSGLELDATDAIEQIREIIEDLDASDDSSDPDMEDSDMDGEEMESDLGEDTDSDDLIEVTEEDDSEDMPEEDDSEDMPEEDDSESDDLEEATLDKEGEEPEDEESEMEQIEREANALKRGKIVGVNKINLDTKSILDALNKAAGKLDQTNAQDLNKVKGDGSTLSAEKGEGFDYENVDVPSGGGKTLADEQGEDFDQSDRPEIPTINQQLGHEDIDTELTDVQTGGEEGAGRAGTGNKAASSNIVLNLEKLAKELSQTNAQDDPALGTISDGKTLSKEKGEGMSDTEGGFDSFDGGGKAMDNETGDGASKDKPDIPVGDGKLAPGENDPEKGDQHTGGEEGAGKSSKKASSNNKEKRAAASSSESESGRKEVAFKMAGQMVKHDMILPEQLNEKVTELMRYEVSQLQDLESAMFSKSSTTKGLTTASRGSEKPLLINERSNQGSFGGLQDQIASLFKLQKQVNLADETESARLGDTFK